MVDLSVFLFGIMLGAFGTAMLCLLYKLARQDDSMVATLLMAIAMGCRGADGDDKEGGR